MIDCFMLNCMRTDLVTIEEPKVIRSYQDIIDREDLKVLFHQGWGDEQFFQHAKEGSKEQEIWSKKYMMEDLSPQSIGNAWQPVADQTMVTLGRDWIGRSCANLGMRTMIQMGIDTFRTMETIDEGGHFFLMQS